MGYIFFDKEYLAYAVGMIRSSIGEIFSSAFYLFILLQSIVSVAAFVKWIIR